MQKALVNILACPMCKGDLEFSVTEENNTEIISGSLFCCRCNENYSIADTTANLLLQDNK